MEIKGRITIDITKLKGICPVCDTYVNDVDESVADLDKTGYEKYLSHSNKYFGHFSLPLCFTCWEFLAEKCEGCGCVEGLDQRELHFTDNNIGMNILIQTTFTSGDVCPICVTIQNPEDNEEDDSEDDSGDD